MGRLIDLVGKRFGRLTVIERSGKDKYKRIKWMCICDCGNEKEVLGANLNRGDTKSCGCLIVENNKTRERVHNMSNTRFYKIWKKIRLRCSDRPHNNAKHNYYLKGIKVCDRWLKFKNFRDDMYESYLKHADSFGEKNTTIERVNNKGDYTPENCRWATYKEQAWNTSKIKPFKATSPNGKEYLYKSQRQFSKDFLINRNKVMQCIKGELMSVNGWVFKRV